MKRDPIVLLVVGMLASVMLLAGVYESHRRRISGVPVIPKSARQTAQDFSLKSLDGKTIHLSDFKGKAVLLNFWATWCEPCKIETPWLVELQNQYGSQGLQILGVDTNDDAPVQDVVTFAKDMGIDYPILVGKESETDAVADAYGGVPFLPQSFVIARDGKVVGRILGLKSKSDIEDAIKLALSQGPVTQSQSRLSPLWGPQEIISALQGVLC